MKNNLLFNNMPGREQVQVLHISSLLGVRSTVGLPLKTLKSYAYTQKEYRRKTRGKAPENSNQVQIEQVFS